MFTRRTTLSIRRLLANPLTWVKGRARLAAAMYCAHPVRARNYTQILWSEFDSGRVQKDMCAFVSLCLHKTYKVCMIKLIVYIFYFINIYIF